MTLVYLGGGEVSGVGRKGSRGGVGAGRGGSATTAAAASHAHDLEVLDGVLEGVVVVVPLGGLDIKDLVVEPPELLDLALEGGLDVEQRLVDLRAARAAEAGQRPGPARADGLAHELHLALADLEQVAAPLHEGVDLREDGRLVELPVARVVGGGARDGQSGAAVDALPRHAARDRLLEGNHGAVHVAVEDFRQRDLGTAPRDDLVGDLAQQARQPLLGVVKPRQRPDHPDARQQAGQDGRDVARLGR